MHVVEVQLKNPSYHIGDRLYVDPVELEAWTGIAYFEETSLCEHQTSMCSECEESWSMDHNLRHTAEGELQQP